MLVQRSGRYSVNGNSGLPITVGSVTGERRSTWPLSELDTCDGNDSCIICGIKVSYLIKKIHQIINTA